MTAPAVPRLAPAYYSAPVTRFVRETPNEVLGTLASENKFALDETQRDAWKQEITILKSALSGIPGTLYLEFDIPRLGSRIDAVLIAGPAIFAIEFKCGATAFHRADHNQAWDYALDLKNFHRGSRYAPIFPILVATDAAGSETTWSPPHADGVRDPAPPTDRVVVFDEAQRAWNATKLANWMKKRNGVADFTMSEPEFLISYLDRHVDWSVVVCLVGGGQEIHDGEAGIGARRRATPRGLDALVPIRESFGVRESRPRLRHEERA